ncbi:MAG: DinB family protein [Cyclobacteriaceae bacterium]|nr:DinB family protein [Cyclobacteriaceae bacterium]
MPRVLIDNIIRQLNEIQEGSLWFDQCFKDKIDGLSEDEAFTRPIPEVHSVAEHISHMLEWRKECILRYQGGKIELMNSPDDWKDNDQLRKFGWTNLKNDLYKSRTELIDLFEGRDDTYLETRFQNTEYNFHYLIEGILQHDLYHLGQIGVTIKLLNLS